jgi:hypothetical protein
MSIWRGNQYRREVGERKKEKQKGCFYGGVKKEVFKTYNYGSSFLQMKQRKAPSLTSKCTR